MAGSEHGHTAWLFLHSHQYIVHSTIYAGFGGAGMLLVNGLSGQNP